jgi:hypothetical protein
MSSEADPFRRYLHIAADILRWCIGRLRAPDGAAESLPWNHNAELAQLRVDCLRAVAHRGTNEINHVASVLDRVRNETDILISVAMMGLTNLPPGLPLPPRHPLMDDEEYMSILRQHYEMGLSQALGPLNDIVNNPSPPPASSLPPALDNLSAALRRLLVYLLDHPGVEMGQLRQDMKYADNPQAYSQLRRLRNRCRELLQRQPFRLVGCGPVKGRIRCAIQKK